MDKCKYLADIICEEGFQCSYCGLYKLNPNICPVCGADKEVWEEVMRDEHGRPGEHCCNET